MHVFQCQKLENTSRNLKTYQKHQQEIHGSRRNEIPVEPLRKTLLDPVKFGDALRMTK